VPPWNVSRSSNSDATFECGAVPGGLLVGNVYDVTAAGRGVA
jgi:hypothetical protein